MVEVCNTLIQAYEAEFGEIEGYDSKKDKKEKEYRSDESEKEKKPSLNKRGSGEG